jgi:hypothetical protein
MANTIQKKIKFSKGQIVPELVERTDLGLYDSSAQNMKNVVSTVYGGVRSRRGTKYISGIYTDKIDATATSSIGGNVNGFQDLTGYKSDNIGTNRIIAEFDYGQQLDGAIFTVKGLKIDGILNLYKSNVAGSFNASLPVSREYFVEIIGAGGGSGGGTKHSIGASGGSGAGFVGYVNLNNGNYKYTVGSGGYAGGSGATAGGNGGSSVLSLNNSNIIVAGGGSGGVTDSHGGSGGAISVSKDLVINKTEVNRSGNNGAGWYGGGTTAKTASVYKDYGYGAGGATWYGVGNVGGTGFASIGVGYITVVVEKTLGNDVWEEVLTRNITTDGVDIDLNVSDFQKIRLRIVENDLFDFNGTISVSSVILYSSSTEELSFRLIPFVYNEFTKYLFVVSSKNILVYENEKLIQKMSVDIPEEYLNDIKYATKDDTLILTHNKMPPKILKNLSEGGWTYGELDLKNIPYAVFGEETEEKKTTGITPSELEGAVKITADSGIFSDAWVGQYIDGNGGRVKITEYISGTVVNGYTVVPFYTKDKITNWTYISGYEPVWSKKRGYPRTCLFAQQRLWFGGSKDKPATVWASRLGDYFNFKNSGNYDNDSIDADLLTNDPIVNMIDNRGLHIFTTGQEMTVSENSFTPDTFSVTTNTRNGSYSRINPVVFGGVVGFIEKNGTSLLSYVYDYNQASYMTDNISLFSNLIKKPVAMSAEVNSEKDKGDFLFLVLEDGSMLVMCVSLNEDVKSISQFKTDGKIVDVVSLKSDTYILVLRKGFFILEKIEDVLTDNTKQFYISGNTLGGLEEYNSQYIYIYNKEYSEKKLITGSDAVLSKNVEGNFNVGIAFDYELESNPIAINGKTVDIKKRISSATLHCKDTPQISFNEQLKKDKDVYNFYACTKYDNDVRFKIKGEFYPMEILSVLLNINYEG